MYMTLIRSVLLYGSLTWPLRKTEETEVRCFRVENVEKNAQIEKWKIRHNQEFRDIFLAPSITKEISVSGING